MKQPILPSTPFTVADAAALGIGEKALRRMRRDGLVIPVRPGLYRLAGDVAPMNTYAHHRELTRKTLEQLGGAYVVAQASAATFHDMWTPRPFSPDRSPVRLYTVDSRNACLRNGLHVTVSPLAPGDVTFIDDLAITSVPRTAVDLARGMSISRALIPLDSALRLGVTTDQLLSVAMDMHRWPGTRLLKRCIPLARAASESALESAARGAAIAAGLPEPALQEHLLGASGSLYRVDLYWAKERLILEPDGMLKYGADEASRLRAFRSEKQREDDLRAAGHRVLRLTWQTLDVVIAQVARLVAPVRH